VRQHVAFNKKHGGRGGGKSGQTRGCDKVKCNPGREKTPRGGTHETVAGGGFFKKKASLEGSWQKKLLATGGRRDDRERVGKSPVERWKKKSERQTSSSVNARNNLLQIRERGGRRAAW